MSDSSEQIVMRMAIQLFDGVGFLRKIIISDVDMTFPDHPLPRDHELNLNEYPVVIDDTHELVIRKSGAVVDLVARKIANAK